MIEVRRASLKRVAIFASGKGSNAEAIISYCASVVETAFTVALIVTNKENAGVIEVAKRNGVHHIILDEKSFLVYEEYEHALLICMKEYEIDFITLAGYLRKIPQSLIDEFKERILNIHPSLLPKYGGKGMYGIRVHEAVLQNKEEFSGITIHVVDGEYDRGTVVAQINCSILNCTTASEVQTRVAELEHCNYAKVVDSYIKQSLESRIEDTFF